MKNLVSQFIADESGAGAVEYAMVLLLALAIVTVVATTLKTQITSMLTAIGVKLSTGINNIS